MGQRTHQKNSEYSVNVMVLLITSAVLVTSRPTVKPNVMWMLWRRCYRRVWDQGKIPIWPCSVYVQHRLAMAYHHQQRSYSDAKFNPTFLIYHIKGGWWNKRYSRQLHARHISLYNDHSHALPSLTPGDFVHVQDHITKKWLPGIIDCMADDRPYVIHIMNRAFLRRNRVQSAQWVRSSHHQQRSASMSKWNRWTRDLMKNRRRNLLRINKSQWSYLWHHLHPRAHNLEDHQMAYYAHALVVLPSLWIEWMWRPIYDI